MTRLPAKGIEMESPPLQVKSEVRTWNVKPGAFSAFAQKKV
jgi:hypothetical protein